MVGFIIFGSVMIAIGLFAIAAKKWAADQRLQFWERVSPPRSAPSRRFVEIDATLGAWIGIAIGLLMIVIGIIAP